MATEAPLPPFDLSARLGHGANVEAARSEYLEQGRNSRSAIERVLPDRWSWDETAVLDFGCGAGRVIRHFLELAPACELWGSDMDSRCIAWNREHLSPAASFVENRELPGLPFEDEKFDLIYALSVFTHISTHWAGWLTELYRVLAPNGLLLATVMSEGMCEAVAGEPWDEGNFGMAVYEAGQSWELGGPMVLHSPWWIEAHWGRLFEIERLMSRGFHANESAQDDQGVVVMRRRPRGLTTVELECIDPDDSREASALFHDVHHLRAEVAELRGRLAG